MIGVRLRVWGDYALFTRPENKGERCSYDVPTPSAMRGILEAIHWKPAIRWLVDRIHVLNPIVFDSIRRNEVSEKGPSLKSVKNAAKNGTPLYLFADECRQQRSTLLLRHVDYVIEAPFRADGQSRPVGQRRQAHRHLSAPRTEWRVLPAALSGLP